MGSPQITFPPEKEERVTEGAVSLRQQVRSLFEGESVQRCHQSDAGVQRFEVPVMGSSNRKTKPRCLCDL